MLTNLLEDIQYQVLNILCENDNEAINVCTLVNHAWKDIVEPYRWRTYWCRGALQCKMDKVIQNIRNHADRAAQVCRSWRIRGLQRH